MSRPMTIIYFLAFLLSIFRCLIPFFWSCIRAELCPPLLLPVIWFRIKNRDKRKIWHFYIFTFLLLLLWFPIFFCSCFSNQDSLSFNVLLNLKHNKILSVVFLIAGYSLWFFFSLLAILKSSFDSFPPRKLDFSLFSFSLHLLSFLVHSFKHAPFWFPQKLFCRFRFPLLQSSFKLLL